ncbi:hypothetical protein MRX96_039439 [Rhipicephalus microplus]
MPSLTLHPSSAVVPRSYRFAVKVPLVVWNTLMTTARMGFLGGSPAPSHGTGGHGRTCRQRRVPLLVLAACVLAVRQATCQPTRSMGPKLVDLSYVFDKNTVYPSPSANFSMDVHYRKTKHGVRYQEENICSSTQGGTHVIVPRHLLKGRWSVTDLPLNQAGGARRGHRRQHPGSA